MWRVNHMDDGEECAKYFKTKYEAIWYIEYTTGYAITKGEE